MITLKPIVPFTGPYRRRVRLLDILVSAVGYFAIGAILAYAILGMAGAWDEAQACWQCAGGVR